MAARTEVVARPKTRAKLVQLIDDGIYLSAATWGYAEHIAMIIIITRRDQRSQPSVINGVGHLASTMDLIQLLLNNSL